MSTAIRGTDVTARERLIPPPGNCVDGPEAPVFVRLDEGAPNPDDLELGKAACASCLHLSVCETNRHELAVQIAKLTHNGIAFIGGEEVESRPDDIRPRVINEVVPFSLKELPDDPKLALSFLRMGVRSGTFLPGSRLPATVSDLTDRFIGQLYGTNRKLHTELTTSETLPIERVIKGIQDMTLILFQHADYDNMAIRRRTKLRYHADRVQPSLHHQISVEFCKDMLSLADQRFIKPERQALYYSPEDYQRLKLQYSDEINATDLHYVFFHSIRDPETELRMRLARLRILQEAHHGTGMPVSVLQQRARWKLTDDPAEGVNRRPTPQRITASAAKAIMAGAKVEEGKRVGLVELSDVAKTVRAMHEEFKDDSTFTNDAIVRFGHLTPEEAVRRGKEIQQQVTQAFVDRDKQPLHRHISDGLLRKRVLIGGYTDYETLYRDCRIKFITGRLSRRKQLSMDPTICSTPSWAVELAMDTYDDYHFEGVAEQLYDLYSVKGLVAAGISELALLQDLNYHSQLDSICHPRNGQYVAFAPGLELLSPLERLAIACYHGLDKLMYGQTISARQLGSLLETTDFDAYVRQTILPRAMSLKETRHGMPVTMMRLSKDLDLIKGTESTYRAKPARNIVTIIGNTVMQIGSADIDLGNNRRLNGDASQWLKRTIYKRCGGQYQEMTPDITDAISKGILVISPEGDDYRIDLHPKLHEGADEQTVASLAHVLGIDTFMYGCDLKQILEARLETSIGQAAQQLAAVVDEIQKQAIEIYEPTEPEPEPESVQQPEAKINPEPITEPVTQDPTPTQQTRAKYRVAPRPSAKHPTEWLAGIARNTVEPDIALEVDTFRATKDDSGQKVYLIPGNIRSRLPAEVIVARAQRLRIYAKLQPSERNSLQAEAKLLRSLPVIFPQAISTMSHLVSTRLTNGQRIRFQTLLAHHMGHSRTDPTNVTTADRLLLDRGIVELMTCFQTYRNSKLGFDGMRHRTERPTTLAIINDLLHPDPRQRRTMRAAIQALHPSLEAEDRRYAHIDSQAELINFGRWAALHLIRH